jgi:hypothetical protein
VLWSQCLRLLLPEILAFKKEERQWKRPELGKLYIVLFHDPHILLSWQGNFSYFLCHSLVFLVVHVCGERSLMELEMDEIIQ